MIVKLKCIRGKTGSRKGRLSDTKTDRKRVNKELLLIMLASIYTCAHTCPCTGAPVYAHTVFLLIPQRDRNGR